jgi:pyruvate formate lyase activating enzyme
MKEALLYQRLSGGKVRCDLCARRCVIFPGRVGIYRVRENRDGNLYSLVYGHPAGQDVDTIEKKPLFHFDPGSTAYSVTTVDCNFHCQGLAMGTIAGVSMMQPPGDHPATSRLAPNDARPASRHG